MNGSKPAPERIVTLYGREANPWHRWCVRCGTIRRRVFGGIPLYLPDDAPETADAYLNGVEYPVRKVDLTDTLVANNAPGPLIDRLMSLGVDSFDSREDVLDRLSHPAKL